MSELLVRDEGPLRRCTLARSHRRNALSRELCDQLQTAIESAAKDIALLVIDHEGDTFSSGADLTEVAPSLIADDSGPAESRTLQAIWGVLAAIEGVAKPVVAVVNGRCMAGGLELALACDLIAATNVARFLDGHLAGGLLPGGGAAIRLPERVGLARSFRLLVEGIEIDAATALAWGLADDVFADRLELEAWLKRLGERLAGSPPGLASAIKRQLSAARHPRDGRRFQMELAELETYAKNNRQELRTRLRRYT